MALPDQYVLRTRTSPTLFVALPLGVLLFVWLPGGSLPLAAILALFGTAGGTALADQMGRDRGSRKQPELWSRWGGAPTTRLLRFRDSPNRTNLDRWRSRLKKLAGHDLPSESEEATDPEGSDERYEAAVTVLRSATRDKSKFPLVFTENCNYGFRRNLWGMKPYGLTVAIVSTMCCWTLVVVAGDLLSVGTWNADLAKSPDPALVMRLVGATVNTAVTAVWAFVVRPGWVRPVAEAYAQRLFEALDTANVFPSETSNQQDLNNS